MRGGGRCGWRGRSSALRSHFQGSGTAGLASGCHLSEPCCYCHFEKLGVRQTVQKTSRVDESTAGRYSWAH